MAQSIRDTPELRRILALPRRSPVPPEGLAEQMTELLSVEGRCPGKPTEPHGLCSVCEAPMRMKPLQALALHDIVLCRGGFLQLDVGEGKTLISLLAAYVLDAQRPLLLLPANLIEKTGRERAKLANHWLIPNHIRLLSFQMLGLVQYASELENYSADLKIVDEAHKLKNPDAAVTRRVARYMERHPETMFLAMTGTTMRKSIRDFAHVLRWCLKDGAPVPATSAEVDDWALALDEKTDSFDFATMAPGALLQLCTPDDLNASEDEVIAARRGFRRRLRETPGVVSSAESGTQVDVPLTIRALRYDMSTTTSAHFKRLREEKVTPDGQEIWEAAQVWAHAKEMALGFHYVQVEKTKYEKWRATRSASASCLATLHPDYRADFEAFLSTARPPEPWRVARRNWFSFVREVLSRSRSIDSPEHVAMMCEAGKLPRELLDVWRAIEPTFQPTTVAIWHDDSALRVCREWMRKPGIVWTEHQTFAEALSLLTGAKYYGAKGRADDGAFVDDGDPDKAIIVSVDANREGRNLQRKWCRNLVVSPAEGSDLWQQLIGRTHRPNAIGPVTVDVFLGCAEHARAWSQAVARARAVRDTTGAESKLLIAKVEWPNDWEIASWSGARWDK